MGMTNTIICKNIPGNDHRHSSVDEVYICWLEFVGAVDDAQAENDAENAWLKAAEAGTPDTWADSDRDRLIELYGYGPPPGF